MCDNLLLSMQEPPPREYVPGGGVRRVDFMRIFTSGTLEVVLHLCHAYLLFCTRAFEIHAYFVEVCARL